MPSTSSAQRRAAAIAEHASPEEIASAGPAVQQMAEGMSKGQLSEFAKTPEKGLPHHKHKKKHDDGRGHGRHGGKGRGDYTR